MRTRSQNFKDKIKEFAREIDFKITLYNGENIDEVFSKENIYNISIVQKGNLLSTMMKELDFEINEELTVGDIIDASFGLKVGNDYEWINYGKYIIYSKEKNEDTNTFNYVAFDNMMLSMVEVDDTSIIQNVSVKTAIENICSKVGLSVTITDDDITNLPNLNKVIHQDTFNGVDMTYRDVLDMICQCLGISMVCDNNVLKLKYFNNNIVDTFDEEYLKNINVSFGEKYGPVNCLTLSRSEDNDIIFRKDNQSIEDNGLNEFKIKDNLIMLYDDREDYIDEIFNQIKGLEYYINDFSSTGITYLEWLDFYNVVVGNNTYKCLLLNDEIKVRQGLEENVYTDMPEEATTDYTTAGKTDKEVSFIVDKQNGNIKAKVSKGEVINEINLDESGASINAEKISLEGKEINLTSDDITIESDNFSVDSDGMITATGGDIGGFKLESTKFEKDLSGKYDYTYDDVMLTTSLYLGTLDQGTPIDSIMDYTNEGSITPFDAVKMINIINGSQENTRIFNGKFEINSEDLKNCIKLSKGGQTIVSMGLGGINTAYLSAKNFSCGHTSSSNATDFIGTTIRSSDGAIMINDGTNQNEIEPGKIKIKGSNFPILTLDRGSGTNAAGIEFGNTNGTLGYIGMTGSVNGLLKRWKSDASTSYDIIDRSIVTNKTSKTYTDVNTNIPTNNTLAYWNGAYNSSNASNLTYAHQGTIQCKPTSLYNNSSGSSGNITLSDSVKNYTYLTIYFCNNNGLCCDVSEFYNPQGKSLSLTTFETTNLRNSMYTVNNKALNYNNGVYREIPSGTQLNGNYIKILKVIGWK